MPSERVTRREILAAKTKKKPKKKKSSVKRVDVAVVGAGLSGLAAARDVLKSGRSVLVLEAQNRVGGRTESQPFRDAYVEHGGVFLIDEERERELIKIARELKIGVIDLEPKGDHLYHRDGNLVRYNRNGPTGRLPITPAAAPEVLAFSQLLEQRIREVPPDRPWAGPTAVELDSQTFASFRDANMVSRDAKWVIDTITETLTGNEPRDLSLLDLCKLVAGAEGLTAQQVVEESGLHRFDGGSQAISVGMAKKLGKRVILNSPVRRIEQRGRKVTLTSDRATVIARSVIVAIPPFLTTRIDWDPLLPPQRVQLSQRVPNATVFRISVGYETPFWYDDGLTGEVWYDNEPLRFAWDVTPPDKRLGQLTAFINGAAARRWCRRSAAERRAGIIDNLVTAFGERARKPLYLFEKGWSFTEWTASCQYGVFPPGVLTGYGESLRPSHGRVHWAGTEVATEWAASMEGAVRAGQSAAKAALAQL
ncbi:MAG TPA: FAD-dependent oxidoreductase [Thermoleophilaceae bacterium]